jgi:hypothetical protein
VKPFNYNKYLRNNPLLREFDDEEGSGFSYEYQEGPGASPQEIARVIKQFQSDTFTWNKLAKNDFYSMAQGESADIKSDYYPNWKKSDFEQVIAALEGGSTSMNEAATTELKLKGPDQDELIDAIAFLNNGIGKGNQKVKLPFGNNTLKALDKDGKKDGAAFSIRVKPSKSGAEYIKSVNDFLEDHGFTCKLSGAKVNEAKNKEKDIEVDIDSADQITLKGKELDSDKLGTNKKYRDLILKAPDKAFMYKGKPATITAVDLNDGSVDEPKIYLTIINEAIGQENNYKKAALEIVALAKAIIKAAEEQLSMHKEIAYASRISDADQLSDLYYHLLDELGDFLPSGMDPFRKGAKKIIVDKYNIEMTDEYGSPMKWR